MIWNLFEFSHIWLYITFELVATISPGPSIFYVLRHAGTSLKNGMMATFGQLSGSSIYAIATILGLGFVIEQYPVILVIVQIAGALYLSYLGLKIFLATKKASNHNLKLENRKAQKTDPWEIYRGGFFTSLSNPKVIIYYTALLPQFIHPNAGSYTLQLLVLCVLGFVLSLIVYFGGSYIVSTTTARMQNVPPKFIRYLNYSFAALFVAFGIRLYFLNLSL